MVISHGLDQKTTSPSADLTKRFSPAPLWEAEVRAYLEQAFGKEAFERISATISTPPLATCIRVNTLQTTRQVQRKKKSRHLHVAGSRLPEAIGIERDPQHFGL